MKNSTNEKILMRLRLRHLEHERDTEIDYTADWINKLAHAERECRYINSEITKGTENIKKYDEEIAKLNTAIIAESNVDVIE